MILTRNGTNLNYEYIPFLYASEKTETIVLIHGAGFDLTIWNKLLPLLQPQYHLILFDLRGHGRSERGTEPFGNTMFEDDLLEILNLLDIGRFHIISHGAGAIISLYFVRDYPNRVLTQTLISLPIFGSQETVQKFADYRKEFSFEQSLRSLAEHLLSFVTLYPPESPTWHELYNSFLSVTKSAYFECINFFLHSHTEFIELFKKCETPTLVLTGEQDPLFPPFLSNLVASLNENVRHRTIYQAANMVFVDQPQETLRQWQEFLQSIGHSKPLRASLFHNFHTELRTLFQIDEESVQKQREETLAFLKVRLISNFEVVVNGTRIENGWNKRNAKELLTYLLIYPEATRERICEDLWPDQDTQKSRNHLRVYLSYLKQLLNVNQVSILQADSDKIQLLASIDCDLLELVSQLNAAYEERNADVQALILSNLFTSLKQEPLRCLTYEWSSAFRTAFEIKLSQVTSIVCKYLFLKGKRDDALAYCKLVSLWYPEYFESDDFPITNPF